MSQNLSSHNFYLNLHKQTSFRAPLNSWAAFDRTRILHNSLAVKEIIPLGLLQTTKSFDELCDKRAEQLIAFAKEQDKKLFVMWSGGVDSTLVLVSLIKLVGPEKISVVMNHHSISEYPFFYEKYIKDRFKELHYQPNKTMYSFIDSNIEQGIFVTGEIADQLFGSMTYFSYTDSEFIKNNWRFAYTTHNSSVIEKLERFVDACPQKITTVKDFLWWVNYTIKYQGVCLRLLIDSTKAVLDNNFFHFFHTKDFNDWAVSTPTEQKFYGTDPKQYKMIAKDYIYKFTNDQGYRDHKTKENSAGSGGAYFNSNYKTIDLNWVRGL
jgi:asparagine synthetase B (glutamine-hydrolysing)